MKHGIFLAGAAALIAGCAPEPARKAAAAPEAAGQPQIPQPSGPPAPRGVPAGETPAKIQRGLVWESIASGEGMAIRLMNPDGSMLMSIACLAGPARLAVNVPSFKPIGSEDRFAFGLGDEPVTLVADPIAQSERPGVTGEGPVPETFGTLLSRANEVSAMYGAQQLGPHMPPPPELGEAFARACAEPK